MKHFSACVAIGVASATHAQLINGSFEVNGGFSLQGWEWSCADPEAWPEAPIGGGDWSAFKEASHAKGCFPSYLFQRLPDVQYGVPYQLSGWVRCPQNEFAVCLGGTIGFGTISNGAFTLAQNVTSGSEDWTFLAVEHVFDPGVGDTAIVVLSAGFAGGPMNPLPAGFDQLSLDLAQGSGEQSPPLVSHYPDPVQDVLYIGIAKGRILSIDLLDEAGRIVHTAAGGTGTRQIPVAAFPAGTYIGRVFTDRGEERFPFVKR